MLNSSFGLRNALAAMALANFATWVDAQPLPAGTPARAGTPVRPVAVSPQITPVRPLKLTPVAPRGSCAYNVHCTGETPGANGVRVNTTGQPLPGVNAVTACKTPPCKVLKPAGAKPAPRASDLS